MSTTSRERAARASDAESGHAASMRNNRDLHRNAHREHGQHDNHSSGMSTNPFDLRQEWRRLIAELFGTFVLVVVAAGADIISTATGGTIGLMPRLLAPALVIMALIFALGDVSGAHLNPAITFGFALRGDFPWRRVPGYWLAQMLGGLLGAIFLRMVFGEVGHMGATLPSKRYGSIPAVLMEAVITTVLIMVVFGTIHSRARLTGLDVAIAVGAVIAMAGLFESPISGASMNPARTFGPDVMAGTLSSMWVYLAGPMAGAIVATGIAWLVDGSPDKDGNKAARG